jgi:hypothetical protein
MIQNRIDTLLLYAGVSWLQVLACYCSRLHYKHLSRELSRPVDKSPLCTWVSPVLHCGSKGTAQRAAALLTQLIQRILDLLIFHTIVTLSQLFI